MRRQNGFTVVEGVVIAALAVVLAFIGWWIWQQNQKTDEGSKKEETSQQSQKTEDQQAPPDYSVIDTVYSKVPADLQQAILAETQKKTPTCVKNGAIVDADGDAVDKRVTYQPAGYAITPIGCEGGFSAFFEKDSSGSWTFVQGTQDYYDCSVILARLESVALFETVLTAPAKCFDGETVVELSTLAP